MSDWDPEQLERIGAAEELQIAPANPDGSLRHYTTIWVVRVGDDLYVRSFRGPDGDWYRHAQQSKRGRIRAGGVERDVAFDLPSDVDHDAIDQAYRTKYARYPDDVAPMVAPPAVASTLRLVAR